MWSMNFRAWRPEMRKRVEELVVMDSTDSPWFTDPRKIFHARVQGNPHYDAGAAYWHVSADDMRASTSSYGHDAVNDYMNVLGAAILRSESPALFEADDPELTEYGEDGMDERLTSMIAEIIKSPKRWPEGQADTWAVVSKYYENMMFQTMEQGWARQGAALEFLRQQLGFPYVWSGAPID